MKTVFIIFLWITCLAENAFSQDANRLLPLNTGVGVVDISGDSAIILDPLHVKAMIFQQGNEQFAIVECDVTFLSTEVLFASREIASLKSGIPFKNVSVAATHTHMANTYKDIPTAVGEAMVLAKAALRPVKLKAGTGQQFNVSFNRRYFMKDGSVVFNPMFLNPDIVRPAGTIDPELNIVMLFNAANGLPVSSLMGFSLHLDIVKEYGSVYQNTGAGSPNAVSADYPYWIEQRLRNDYGKHFNLLFLTGACGNINHWDFSKPGPQSGHKTKSKEVGDSLYYSFKRALPELTEEIPSLASRSRIINVPLQTFTKADLIWAQQVEPSKLSSRSEEPNERQLFLDNVKRKRILWLNDEKNKGYDNTLPLDVQVFRLSNNTAIVTLPGEMFVEHGLAVKSASPFANTIIVELANNGIAYVPDRKAFLQGAYEVVNSRLAPGGGEIMVEAAIQMLKELKTDAR